MAADLNTVNLIGRLTRDPESRDFNGTTCANLRIAVNGQKKDQATGNYEDKPNFFDVSVWAGQADACMKYLTKGRGVAITGKLDWREWEQDGVKRQTVSVVANSVQFLSNGEQQTTSAPKGDVHMDTSDFASPAGSRDTDDIPF